MCKLVTGVGATGLFPQAPTIRFSPEVDSCPHCDEAPKTIKTREKRVVTMDIGALTAKETVLQCPRCKTVFVSRQLRALAPDQCTFGYDVIVYVGLALFARGRNEVEVIRELAQKNVFVSRREISQLGRKFVAYLAIVHRESRQRLRGVMEKQGGYILHVDGTCEGGSPFIFCALDGISHWVLDNIKIPSEKKELLIPFLHRIEESFGEPLALMHDMGSGILEAVAEVFPNAPDFICHFHFLRDVGKDLLLRDYQTIMDRLRKSNVRGRLRKKAAYLEKKVGRDSQTIRDLSASLASGTLTTDRLEQMPAVVTHALIHWAFEAPRVSKGYGFPFDRPHLEFYLRLKEIHRILENIMDIRLRKVPKDNRPFVNVRRLIGEVLSDKKLKDAVYELERKGVVFDELRAAMRIAPPDGGNGLNDDGCDVDMKTMEKGVRAFREELEKREDRQTCYKKMAEQIDKYRDKLFADPIVVDTPDGPLVVTPQRTNNILERFFRSEKRTCRRRSGTSSLSKTLKSMLADTPLVSNLDDERYREVILDGCESLEERFSRIDAKFVREEMKQAQRNQEKITPEVRKIIRRSDLPQKVSTLFSTFFP